MLPVKTPAKECAGGSVGLGTIRTFTLEENNKAASQQFFMFKPINEINLKISKITGMQP